MMVHSIKTWVDSYQHIPSIYNYIYIYYFYVAYTCMPQDFLMVLVSIVDVAWLKEPAWYS